MAVIILVRKILVVTLLSQPTLTQQASLLAHTLEVIRAVASLLAAQVKVEVVVREVIRAAAVTVVQFSIQPVVLAVVVAVVAEVPLTHGAKVGAVVASAF